MLARKEAEIRDLKLKLNEKRKERKQIALLLNNNKKVPKLKTPTAGKRPPKNFIKSNVKAVVNVAPFSSAYSIVTPMKSLRMSPSGFSQVINLEESASAISKNPATVETKSTKQSTQGKAPKKKTKPSTQMF